MPRGANDEWLNFSVGARIRAARKARDLSQRQLADQIGVSIQQVSKYESGRDRLTVPALFRIARALDEPVIAFLPVDDTGEEASMELKAAVEMLSPEDAEVIRYLAEAPPRLREAVGRMLKTVASEMKDE